MISWFKRWRYCSRIAGVEALIFALIMAAAVCLRLRLLSEGMWRDEGFTYFDIAAPDLRGLIDHIRVSEANPPLFFIMLRGWAHLFGFGETALKSLPFLWSVAAVIATYLLARRCVSRPVALGAAVLIATSYEAIAYSNDIRPYAMAQCLATVCVLLYDRVLFGGKIRTLAAWSVVTVALIWTHYVGIIIVAALLLSTIVVRRRIVVRPWVLLGAYALVAASFLPWLSIFTVQVQSGTPWADVLTPFDRLGVVFEAIGTFSPFAPWLEWWCGSLVGKVFATMLLLVAAAAAHRMRQSPSRDRSAGRLTQERSFAFVVLVLTVVLGLSALVGYRLGRYFVPFIPLVCVLYAGLIGQIFEGMRARAYPMRNLRWWLGGLGFAAVCMTILMSIELGTKPKSGIRTLVATSAPLVSDSQVLWIVAPDYAASTLGYYLREKRGDIHGFARWDEPQFFRIPGYAALWSDPRLVDDTLARIDSYACNGFTRLALVRPIVLGYILVDLGKVPYSRERIFEKALERRYHLIYQRSYAGREEEASLKLFRLRCGHERFNGV